MLFTTSKEWMSITSYRLVAVVVAILLLLATIYVNLYNPNSSRALLGFQSNKSLSNETLTKQPDKDELDKALEETSMGNKTLIITVLNKAYANESSMLDLFLRSFQLGGDTAPLVNHILFVAVDQKAYNRCKHLNLHCYKLVTEGVDFSNEELYMSADFINMMWKRTFFLTQVLKRGYNFVFTDMDVMWLRNPFPVLGQQGEDLQLSCDWYNGKPFDQSNGLNTGFYYAASNEKTIALFSSWYAARNSSERKKEQDVLSDMKNIGFFKLLGLKVRFLDVAYFAGFCKNKKSFKDVRTIHANCCRSIKAKLADLALVLEEWKSYNGTDVPLTWHQTRACYMSWRQKVG